MNPMRLRTNAPYATFALAMPILLGSCAINDDMGSCEKAGLISLYVVAALALGAVLVGVTLLSVIRH